MNPTTSAALQRLKEARTHRQQAAGRHAAAASDGDNEAYMQEFESAFQQLSSASSSTSSNRGQLPHATFEPQHRHKPRPVPSATPAAASAPSTTAPTSKVIQAARSRAETCTERIINTSIASGWRTGPVEQAGRQQQHQHTNCPEVCLV
jgi:hypothetical protein